eukprot:3499-Heterococcus_DN1.PRE.5
MSIGTSIAITNRLHTVLATERGCQHVCTYLMRYTGSVALLSKRSAATRGHNPATIRRVKHFCMIRLRMQALLKASIQASACTRIINYCWSCANNYKHVPASMPPILAVKLDCRASA